MRVGTHKETGFQAAIKIINKEVVVKKPDLWEKIKREVVILKLMEHPHVLKLFDVLESRSKLYLVLEFVKGGDLYSYIVKRGPLPRPEALRLFAQLIQGLEYCHQHQVCHRDLKPENLLLDEKNNVKIADFGLAQMMSKRKLLKTSCGSPHYASPEVVSGKPYDGQLTDIWSAGIILYALLTSRVPFDAPNLSDLLQLVVRGSVYFPNTIDPDIQDLIKRMLSVDPSRRIRAYDIKYHAIFVSTNFFPAKTQRPVVNLSLHGQEVLDDHVILDLVRLGLGPFNEVKAILMQPTTEPTYEHVFYRLLIERKRSRLEALKRLSPLPIKRFIGHGHGPMDVSSTPTDSPVPSRAAPEHTPVPPPARVPHAVIVPPITIPDHINDNSSVASTSNTATAGSEKTITPAAAAVAAAANAASPRSPRLSVSRTAAVAKASASPTAAASPSSSGPKASSSSSSSSMASSTSSPAHRRTYSPGAFPSAVSNQDMSPRRVASPREPTRRPKTADMSHLHRISDKLIIMANADSLAPLASRNVRLTTIQEQARGFDGDSDNDSGAESPRVVLKPVVDKGRKRIDTRVASLALKALKEPSMHEIPSPTLQTPPSQSHTPTDGPSPVAATAPMGARPVAINRVRMARRDTSVSFSEDRENTSRGSVGMTSDEEVETRFQKVSLSRRGSMSMKTADGEGSDSARRSGSNPLVDRVTLDHRRVSSEGSNNNDLVLKSRQSQKGRNSNSFPTLAMPAEEEGAGMQSSGEYERSARASTSPNQTTQVGELAPRPPPVSPSGTSSFRRGNISVSPNGAVPVKKSAVSTSADFALRGSARPMPPAFGGPPAHRRLSQAAQQGDSDEKIPVPFETQHSRQSSVSSTDTDHADEKTAPHSPAVSWMSVLLCKNSPPMVVPQAQLPEKASGSSRHIVHFPPSAYEAGVPGTSPVSARKGTGTNATHPPAGPTAASSSSTPVRGGSGSYDLNVGKYRTPRRPLAVSSPRSARSSDGLNVSPISHQPSSYSARSHYAPPITNSSPNNLPMHNRGIGRYSTAAGSNHSLTPQPPSQSPQVSPGVKSPIPPKKKSQEENRFFFSSIFRSKT